MSRSDLARRQAELVAALILGEPAPAGFDPSRVRATADALLRKRAAEVGAQWPALRVQFGPQWSAAFADWARGRVPQGSLRDGWDFARTLALHPATAPSANPALSRGAAPSGSAAPSGRAALSTAAALELATREARFAYDGVHPPRPRRLPAIRRAPGALVLQLGGRTWTGHTHR